MQVEDVFGPIWIPLDGLVDPNSVVQGYISGAKRLGAKCLTDVEVKTMTLEKGEKYHVKTPVGEIETPIIVNAAGPWAAQIGTMIGLEIPVVPVRRQIAVTTPIPQLPPDFPFVIEFAKNLYFHREGPGILTGMSNLHEPPSFNQDVDRDWELKHFDEAMSRMPLLEEVGISSRLFLQAIKRIRDFQGTLHRKFGMVRLIKRSSPECNNLISRKLVKRTFPLEYPLAHVGKVFIQDRDNLLRLEFFRQGCEPNEVHE